MKVNKYLNNLYRLILIGFILFSFNRCGKKGDQGETLSQEEEATSENVNLVTNLQHESQPDLDPIPKIDVVELLKEFNEWG